MLASSPFLALVLPAAMVAAEPARMDFGGTGDNCLTFDVPDGAFPHNGILNSFRVDNSICEGLGACPSAVTLLAGSDVVCRFGDGFAGNGFQGEVCEGKHFIAVKASDGQRNFPEGLNDNLQRIMCQHN